ncbi:hypothetical protein VNO77_05978 [Canavalia gladiata]|uniref:Uncharacterized protein n=1 Tax=Canavalia gladiata TaxID=3824 RepID=A0AAN9MZB4_CANGL
MENEIIIFINVWIQVMVYLYYCHVIGQTVPKGLRRLWAILPIVFLFLILPFRIHNLHFGGFFVFFISWLANFKLLLFAFGKGPLSDSSLSLKHFVCFSSVPIKGFRSIHISTRHTLLPPFKIFGPEDGTSQLTTSCVSACSSPHRKLRCVYLGLRMPHSLQPTWEIKRFFILHGLCILIELSLKKKLPPRFLLPRVVSGPLTLGFIMLTAFWLFFPQLLRCNGDQKALQEIEAGAALIKNATLTLTFWLHALYSALIHS